MRPPRNQIEFSDENSKRLPSLDGLRAVAISMVLVGHGHFSIPLTGEWTRNFWLIGDNGHLGVEIFFVISGYLITYLLKKEQQKNNAIDLPAFYLRRVLRILPAYNAFLAALMVLASIGMVAISQTDFLIAATYTWNCRALFVGLTDSLAPQNWYLGHTWSLSLEEQFYLLWPPILVLCGLKRSAAIALGLIIAEPFIRVGTYLLWPALSLTSVGALPWTLDSLMIGAFAALCRGNPWFEVRMSFLTKGAIVFLAALFLIVFSPILRIYFRGGYSLGFAPTLDSIAILSVLFWLMRHPQTRVGRFFNSPPMIAMGYLSYSLYLWQQVFLVPWHTGLSILQQFPTNYLACFSCAAASYFLIEKPFLRLKGRVSPQAQCVHGLPVGSA